MAAEPQPQPQPLLQPQQQPVPAWVVGSLPEGFLHREEAPQEAVWTGRPALGVSQSVQQPGAAQERLMALAPLRATLASVPRSRMIEYRLATMSAEEALREQAAMREAQSPSRWDGTSPAGYTRAHLPLRGGVESDPRWLAGTGASVPPARPSAAPPNRSRPKAIKRKTSEQIALGFKRPNEEPLQKDIVGGRAVVTYSVQNHAQVLPAVRTDGSEIAPSDPRPFVDMETEEEKRARVLRASSRAWLRTEPPGDGPSVTVPATTVGAQQAAATVPSGTIEQQGRQLKAAQRQQQETASQSATVNRLLRILGVDDTPEPKDPMNAACLFAKRVEANVERSFNHGTLYEGRRADKATLWRVLRDYLLEENFDVDHEGLISPVDLRRGFVQLGLVPTDDVFTQLLVICRQIADPEFDPVLSDQPIWLWEMRDMHVDIDSTVSLEHLAGAIRQLAALGEPSNRKVTHFPRSECAAVAAHLVWHDENEGFENLCKTDSNSRRQSVRHKQWRPVAIAVICLHLLLGFLGESDGDSELEDKADEVATTSKFIAVQVASLACAVMHSADCMVASRLAAAWTSDANLMTRVVLTSLVLVDEIAFLTLGVVAGRDGASHYFDTRALRPLLLVLHPGAYVLRRELSRLVSLLFVTWELLVLLLIVVFGVLRSFALTQPDLVVLALTCPLTETNDVLLLFCGAYTFAMLVIWALAIAATLTHWERLSHDAQFREAERRKVVLRAAFTVLDLDNSGTISDQDFGRYALHMADEGNVCLSENRVRHIWETIVTDSTSATYEQFVNLNSELLCDIADHAPLWCTAHAECTMPRVAEPCLKRVKECDVLAPAIGGDLTEPFKPEEVIISRFEHVWRPSRQSKVKDAAITATGVEPDERGRRAQADKREKLTEDNNRKPRPKWHAAQEILDRGKTAGSKVDGIQRELFYLSVPRRVNPLLVWEPADAVMDLKKGKPAHPYRQVQNHGVAIARSMVFKSFSADEFSDPASRLLDVHCEYGPPGPTTKCGRLLVGGLWPKQLRKVVIMGWQWCLGEYVALLALLLPTVVGGDSSRSDIVIARLLCCAILLVEVAVTVLALGAVGYWCTALHRRHALTTGCFVLSLLFELTANDHDSGDKTSSRSVVINALSALAHMVAASRLLGLMRLLRPKRGESAATSTVWLVSTVASQCSTALGLHVLLLSLLLYSSAAALHFDDVHDSNSTAAATTPESGSTMAARLVSEAVLVLGGGQGVIELQSGSIVRRLWLLMLLWVTRVLLLCSAIGHVVVCWRLESQRYRHYTSQTQNGPTAEFERRNALTTDPDDGRMVLQTLDDQMTPLWMRFNRGCRRWFRLLTTPHEWPIKEKITEDRICGCCLMRQATCGPLHPVFMPLRRAKQGRRHHGTTCSCGADDRNDDDDNVIPSADVMGLHAPMPQQQETPAVEIGGYSLTPLSCAAAMTGSSEAVAARQQRRGFEPIWSCGACVAVYMAQELMSMEKREGEPSEEEIGKAKDQQKQLDKVEKKAEGAAKSFTSRQRGRVRRKMDPKRNATSSSITNIQHTELEPEPEPEPDPETEPHATEAQVRFDGAEQKLKHVSEAESEDQQNDEDDPKAAQEHYAGSQQQAGSIVDVLTWKVDPGPEPERVGRKLSQ